MDSDSIGWRRARGRLERAAKNGSDHHSKTNGCARNNRLPTFAERCDTDFGSTADVSASSTERNKTRCIDDRYSKPPRNISCSNSVTTRNRNTKSDRNAYCLKIVADICIALIFSTVCALRLNTTSTTVGMTWQEKPIIYDVDYYKQKQFFVPRHQPPGLGLVLYFLTSLNEEADVLGISRKIAKCLLCVHFSMLYTLHRLLGFRRITSVVISAALLSDDAFILTGDFELVNLTTSLLLILCILCSFLQSSKSLLTISWLILTILFGLTVALALCTSYRSLFFTIPLVFGCLYRSLTLLSDKTWMTAKIFSKIATEFLVLLILPTAIYLAIFHVHLKMASRTSIQAAQMTSSFQMSLTGGLSSFTANQSVFTTLNSRATIRSFGNACWLNSNNLRYPLVYADGRVSSHQQVVGCYSFKDANNWWVIESDTSAKTYDHVSYGDIIKLRHRSTGHLLNSHNVSAALTPQAQEISCYVNNTASMQPQTSWKLINPTDLHSLAPIRAMKDPFQLVHVNTKTNLRLSRKRLPDWGGGKLELVADHSSRNDLSDWFNFEENMIPSNTASKIGEKDVIALNIDQLELNFYEKIVEIHRSIWNSAGRSMGFLESAHTIDFWHWATYRNLSIGYYWEENGTFKSIIAKSNDITRFCLHISSAVFVLIFVIGWIMRQREMVLDEGKWNLLYKVAEHVTPLFIMQLVALFVCQSNQLLLPDYHAAMLTSLIMFGAVTQWILTFYL